MNNKLFLTFVLVTGYVGASYGMDRKKEAAEDLKRAKQMIDIVKKNATGTPARRKKINEVVNAVNAACKEANIKPTSSGNNPYAQNWKKDTDPNLRTLPTLLIIEQKGNIGAVIRRETLENLINKTVDLINYYTDNPHRSALKRASNSASRKKAARRLKLESVSAAQIAPTNNNASPNGQDNQTNNNANLEQPSSAQNNNTLRQTLITDYFKANTHNPVQRQTEITDFFKKQ